jgi:hypothetical protein
MAERFRTLPEIKRAAKNLLPPGPYGFAAGGQRRKPPYAAIGMHWTNWRFTSGFWWMCAAWIIKPISISLSKIPCVM